jgi:hypothetical protein
MKTNSRLFGPNKNRGSAFIAVMIFTTVLLLITAGMLNLSLVERKLNKRNAYWLEARNAAEAVAEYGAAQVITSYESHPTPNSFDPAGSYALTLPPSSLNAFTGTSIDTTAYSSSHPTGMQLMAGTTGQYASTGDVVLNASDPANNEDINKGTLMGIKNVQVLAKATCVPPDGGAPVTCFVKQTVSVRYSGLFKNAIFYYNSDLEIFPGPQFDIYGPVRVNGNLFASSQGSSLVFHDTVAASGEVYHAWANQNPWGEGAGANGSGESLGTTPVKFATSVSNNTQLDMNLSGVWKDSTNGTDGSLFSAGVYVNHLTPALTQLQNLTTGQNAGNLTNFDSYAQGTWNGNLKSGSMGVLATSPVSYTSPIDAAGDLPDPHTMIEPPSPPASSDPYADAKTQVENQKISTQAGLYLQVRTVGANTTITAYGPPSGVTGTPNGGALINSWTNPASGLFSYMPYSRTGNNVTSGMYDQRQAAGVNLVQIDMGALNAALAVTANVAGNNPANAIKDTSNNVWGNGANGWNGAIYVDVVEPTTPGPGVTQTGVILTNGTVPPGNSLIPTTNTVKGLTVATNAPVYVLGNFNADGTITAGATGSATMPDDGNISSAGLETPTAIYADAITLLSPDYFKTNSSTHNVASSNDNSSSAYKSYSNVNPGASGSIEVAAAMVTGLVTTDSTASSGGVHNLPRFLESWGNTVSIRGSLIAMYNSKTAIGKWSTAYYGPPPRVWGYDKLFQNGNFPPKTPRTISERRIQSGFTNNATIYSNWVNTLWSGEGLYP